MDEQQNPQEAADSAKDHVKAAADDFKTAASAKAEEIRRAAEQRAEELRRTAESKAREFRGMVRGTIQSQNLANRGRGVHSRKPDKGGFRRTRSWIRVGTYVPEVINGFRCPARSANFESIGE